MKNRDENGKHLDGSKKAAKAYIANLEINKIEFELASLARVHEQEEMSHKLMLAQEQHSGIFRLYGTVDACSVERLRLSTARYAAAYPDEPITLVISSGGGSVFDGWVLFDHLRALSAQGHKITTVVRGMAGSMAAVLTQAGDVRVIGPESYLVIHEPSSSSWGKTSDLIDELDMMKRLTRQAEDVFARRSKLSAKEIKAKTLKKDWYVAAKESKSLGFVDQIG
jgi:ATP-dependent protease ClpP protease subunit